MTGSNKSISLRSGRIPSLDGLRALSIGMVLFAHTSGTRFFPTFEAAARDLGNAGVRVFFVISGFLITSLLIEEHETTGVVSLKMFYLRRAFRIFPCAYAYIILAWILSSIGWVPLDSRHLLHAATYTVNYDPVRPWHLIHLWSLSVEEQFYMLWPAVICLCGVRRGIRIAAAVLFLAPLIRLATWFFVPSLRWSIGTSFQTNADALAAGCVLAGLQPWLARSPRYLRFLTSRTFWIVPLVGAACASLLSFADEQVLPRLVCYGAGYTLLNVSIALSIDRSVRHPDDTIGRLLNTRPVVFAGVLSYSLYLWQEPFLNRLGHSAINYFPLNLVMVGLAAFASYYIVEKPFLNLRRKVERVMLRPKRVPMEITA